MLRDCCHWRCCCKQGWKLPAAASWRVPCTSLCCDVTNCLALATNNSTHIIRRHQNSETHQLDHNFKCVLNI